MFRSANPNSRLPVVLQAHTKQNLIFQLALVGGFLAFVWTKDAYERRQLAKQIKYGIPTE